MEFTIQISSPVAKLYGHLIVGTALTRQWVQVMPGVTAMRTHFTEADSAGGAAVVTMVLSAADTVAAGDLAKWLYGRLCTFRGRPVAPDAITIDGHTVEFREDEIARAVEETMRAQAEDR